MHHPANRRVNITVTIKLYPVHNIFRSENNMGMYCHFIHFLKIVHFCYFQNTLTFVSMSRQTDDIGKKCHKNFVEQCIVIPPGGIDLMINRVVS